MNPTQLRELLQKRIEPAQILGEVTEFPYEKDGQRHLWKSAWRGLVAVTSYGPLVVMEWKVNYLCPTVTNS